MSIQRKLLGKYDFYCEKNSTSLFNLSRKEDSGTGGGSLLLKTGIETLSTSQLMVR